MEVLLVHFYFSVVETALWKRAEMSEHWARKTPIAHSQDASPLRGLFLNPSLAVCTGNEHRSVEFLRESEETNFSLLFLQQEQSMCLLLSVSSAHGEPAGPEVTPLGEDGTSPVPPLTSGVSFLFNSSLSASSPSSDLPS